MQWKVISSEPTNCEAEGRYRGYVVKVFGKPKPAFSSWSVAVVLRELEAHGRATHRERVLDASGLSARDADDVFAQGFALAMSHMDSSLNP